MKTEHDWREAMTEVNSTPAVYHLSNALKSAVFNRLTPAAAKAHQQAQIVAMQAKKPIPGLGIPCALGHPVHADLDTHSTATWTLIPRPLGH